MPSINSNRILKALALATTIAIPAEGLRQVAYYDPPGILTVCYGHTGKDVDKTRKYSLEECRVLLDTDMRGAIAVVERCAPGLPEKALAAFGDAVYNLGSTIACKRNESRAARYLAAGNLEAACNELPRWNKARVAGVLIPLPGLTNRRAKERELCLEGAGACFNPRP
jgi:GH24 family phage-related lysozyme (muramidase)